jgi:hypothetical protein
MSEIIIKRGRGRPKGSKNKPKVNVPVFTDLQKALTDIKKSDNITFSEGELVQYWDDGKRAGYIKTVYPRKKIVDIEMIPRHGRYILRNFSEVEKVQ